MNSSFLHVYFSPELIKKIHEVNVVSNDTNSHGIFLLLNVDSNMRPISVVSAIVEKTSYIPRLPNNNVFPHFLFIPFKLDKRFFKCDNCNITGQNRGYMMYLGQMAPRYFCTICTEGV